MNHRRNENPVEGEFCSPEQVALRLRTEAGRTGIHTFRISGAEPVLGERSARHLAEVLGAFPGRFILATNGIILGYSPDLLDLLLPHKPYIRLTIKGDCPERFEEITGAAGAAFRFQATALHELPKRGGDCGIAAMEGAVDSSGLHRSAPIFQPRTTSRQFFMNTTVTS